MFSRALLSLRRSREYRFLLLFNVFYVGGNWAVTLVLGWMVWEATASELMLAGFSAVRMAPLWLGPISGVLVDRYNRVTLLKLSSIWSFSVMAILAVITMFTGASYWILVIAGFLVGLSQSPWQPARNSLTMQLVGRENLANANALNAMGMGVTQAVAPAVGGFVLGSYGATVTLWYASLWFLMAFALMWKVNVAHRTVRIESLPIMSLVTEGLRLVLRNRLTTAVIVITLAANILIWPMYQSFLPVFASDVLDLGPAGLGRLMMFAGIGSFIGSFIIASMGDFPRKGAMFVFGSMVWGTGWALFGLSQIAIVSYALILGIGIISAAFGVMQATLTLMTSAPEVQGRALGILELAIGAGPFGTILLGMAAQSIGVSATTVISAALFVIILAMYTLRVPDLIQFRGTGAQLNVAATQSEDSKRRSQCDSLPSTTN